MSTTAVPAAYATNTVSLSGPLDAAINVRKSGSVQPSDMHDLVRTFRVEGDRLILNPPGTGYFVFWERFK